MKHIKTFEVLQGSAMSTAFAKDLKFLRLEYNKLMVSIYNNSFSDFKKLLNTTNLEEVDKEGNTALLIASNYGRTKMLKELIKHGASITHKNNNGEDFYDLAVNRFKFINGTKDWIEEQYPEYIMAKKYNL